MSEVLNKNFQKVLTAESEFNKNTDKREKRENVGNQDQLRRHKGNDEGIR